MYRLSELRPAKGSRKRRKLVGRGESSGHGKTSTRGGKGQSARAGGTIKAGFEGGQTPLARRLPKLGFRSRQKNSGMNQFDVVNLDVLEQKFSSGSVVDAAAVWALGIGRTNARKAGVKVLGTGTLSKKLTVKVQAVSASAKEKIEAAGGSVEIVIAG